MGLYTTTTKKTGSTDYEALLKIAEAQGIKPKTKVPFLTRVSNVLTSFEPGGEVTTFIKEKKRGADDITATKKAAAQYISELTRGLGSAIPFLDPYTKPTELRENQQGFASALKEAGMAETPITIAGKRLGSVRGALGLAGDIFLDPGNLLLIPIFKNVGKGVSSTTKLIKTGLEGSDTGKSVLKAGTAIADALGEAFVPAYKAKKISPEMVDFVGKLKRTVNMGDRESAEIVAGLVKKYGTKTFNKVPYELEEYASAIAKGKKFQLTEAAAETKKIIEQLTSGEVGLKLRDTTLPGYFPRIVKEAPTAPVTPSGFPGRVPPMQPTLKGATKKRVFESLAEGEKAGYKYAEAPEALVRRLATSQRAQELKHSLNQLVAGEIKDVNGNPIVKRIAGGKVLEGNVPVLIDKQGVQIGDKLLRFYPTTDEAGKTLIAATKRKAIYQMPKDAAEYLANAQKVFGNDEATKQILRTYDKVLNLWKGSVTSWFPSFHIRNSMGNIFNNYVGGVTDPKVYTEAAELQKGTGALTGKWKTLFPDQSTFEEVRKLFGKLGVTNQGQFAVESTGELEKLLGKTPLGETISEAPRAVGTAIENNARIAHFLDKAKKGLTYDDAAKSVNKYLFDYSDLAPFEQEVMKRIFPFYTFTRKNIPLQIEQILKQPQKYKPVFDAIRDWSAGDLTPEEMKYMPDYLKNKLTIFRGRSPEGDPIMMGGLNLPLEDIGKLDAPVREAIGMMNPLIKSPLEITSGSSFFYGKPIKDTSAYNSTTKLIGSIPGIKDYLKAKKVVSKSGKTYYQVDPERMYALKLLFGRFVGTAEKLSDERVTPTARLATFITGMRDYFPDIDKAKEEQILEVLKELGLVKTFTKDYIPKEVKKGVIPGLK